MEISSLKPLCIQTALGRCDKQAAVVAPDTVPYKAIAEYLTKSLRERTGEEPALLFQSSNSTTPAMITRMPSIPVRGVG